MFSFIKSNRSRNASAGLSETELCREVASIIREMCREEQESIESQLQGLHYRRESLTSRLADTDDQDKQLKKSLTGKLNVTIRQIQRLEKRYAD